MALWERRLAGSGKPARYSARRSSRAAVQPKRPAFYRADAEQPSRRPGIPGEARPDLILVRRLDHVQRLFAITDGATEDDKAIIDEPVHESRVLIPAILVPYLAGRIPARTVN